MNYYEAKAFMSGLGLKAKTEAEARLVFHNWYNINRKLAEEIGLPEFPEIEFAPQTHRSDNITS